MTIYHYIGAASGWGAKLRACEKGSIIVLNENPNLVSSELLLPKIHSSELYIPLESSLSIICDINDRLANRVYEVLLEQKFPIILSGDHSIAVGTWNGFYHYFDNPQSKPIGLLWIDAHMDSHIPKTSPSGAWHGMSLAALLGYGDTEFRCLKMNKSVLRPENTCLIGVRSFEEGEAELLQKLKVRVFFADEIKKRGMKSVMEEALMIVNDGTVGFGVSLDIDSLDPLEAPGVGSPEPDGLSEQELCDALSLLRTQKKFKAFELAEYNPELDREKKH